MSDILKSLRRSGLAAITLLVACATAASQTRTYPYVTTNSEGKRTVIVTRENGNGVRTSHIYDDYSSTMPNPSGYIPSRFEVSHKFIHYLNSLVFPSFYSFCSTYEQRNIVSSTQWRVPNENELRLILLLKDELTDVNIPESGAAASNDNALVGLSTNGSRYGKAYEAHNVLCVRDLPSNPKSEQTTVQEDKAGTRRAVNFGTRKLLLATAPCEATTAMTDDARDNICNSYWEIDDMHALWRGLSVRDTYRAVDAGADLDISGVVTLLGGAYQSWTGATERSYMVDRIKHSNADHVLCYRDYDPDNEAYTSGVRLQGSRVFVEPKDRYTDHSGVKYRDKMDGYSEAVYSKDGNHCDKRNASARMFDFAILTGKYTWDEGHVACNKYWQKTATTGQGRIPTLHEAILLLRCFTLAGTLPLHYTDPHFWTNTYPSNTLCNENPTWGQANYYTIGAPISWYSPRPDNPIYKDVNPALIGNTDEMPWLRITAKTAKLNTICVRTVLHQ